MRPASLRSLALKSGRRDEERWCRLEEGTVVFVDEDESYPCTPDKPLELGNRDHAFEFGEGDRERVDGGGM